MGFGLDIHCQLSRDKRQISKIRKEFKVVTAKHVILRFPTVLFLWINLKAGL